MLRHGVFRGALLRNKLPARNVARRCPVPEPETRSSWPRQWTAPTAYLGVSLVLLTLVLAATPLAVLDLIVKLLVGLSWPLAVLIAAFWFRPEIRSKLRDLSEIGKGGAKFVPAVQPQGIGDPASPGPIASNIGSDRPSRTGAAQVLRPQDTVAPVYQPLVAALEHDAFIRKHTLSF